MLRIRRSNALLGGAILFSIIFMIYLVVDTINLQQAEDRLKKMEMSSLEVKLQHLENDLLLNQKAIDQIKQTLQSIRHEQKEMRDESKAIRGRGQPPVNKTFASIAKDDYLFAQSGPRQCDIRMSDVYEALPFDNPDGGAWKQGWDVRYNEQQATDPQNKLRVFVIPHSHCDPGWIKTFEKYYVDQARHILTNMINKLSENPRRKFIYAEISFFSLWWNDQPLEMRDKTLKLLSNGQFELATGGWVMPDEANSYYYALVEQMMTGHEWMKLNLNGYKPNNGWSIDPFGMSPTTAYLLKRMGFDNMLIQRTHYSVKKHLASSQDLEFMWRQHWDHEDTTDMLTHMMPFYSYDIPHTCGPDPKICCQFDFARLKGGIATCPWRVPPRAITSENVAERSFTLLDQYRKKAELYKSNVLLVPLGDDFRYDNELECSRQFENYEKIMDYISSQPKLNAEVQFGTLEDYFNALREEAKSKTGSEVGLFKSLSGDFFTYADRDDHYWSGYFTSRPFYKNMDRVLGGFLRGAEILFSLMWAEMEYVGADISDLANPLMEALIYARRSIALFQHHDGITGTAKDHVVVDYGKKMLESLNGLQELMSHAAHYLLTPNKANYQANVQEVFFDLDENREHHFALPKQYVIQMDQDDLAYRVVIFNSQARRRVEVVTIRVSRANVKVFKVNNVEGDDEEETMPSQISPVFDDEGQILNNEFMLTFFATVNGLSLQTYFIQVMKPEEGANNDMDVANVRIYNSKQHPFQVAPFDQVAVFDQGESFELQNGYVRAKFDTNGFLQAIISLDDNSETKAKLEFVRYGTRERGDQSGAYLFLPNGPAQLMHVEDSRVRIITGKILSYVEVELPYCRHIVTVKSSPGVDGTGLEITNLVDVSRLNNQELAMRITSDVNSGDEFFTDLNGFQMIRRKRFNKLPLQANYYPVPSMAYIQDDRSRLTLISGQPLGGSSLSSGQIEIMLDRRLMQDDNRGLFQGVKDNHPTPNKFFLLVEKRIPSCKDEAADPAASYPSLLSVSARHSLINPLFRLIWAGAKHRHTHLTKTYEPMEKDLPCDVHLVSLRTLQASAFKHEASDDTAVVLHRQGFNGCYKPVGMTCSTNGGKFSLQEMFPELFSSNVKQMSLSLLYEGMDMEKTFTVSIKPMEMYSFLMKR